MTSRERLQKALNHQQPDRVPVDIGGTAVTGIHVSAVTRLRRAVLADESYRVKVIEPYQMLGEVDDELADALGIDVIGLRPRATMFGFENTGWKSFTLFDGTEALVPEKFNVTKADDGGWVIYPEGDTSAPPSGHMPKGAFFFDSIIRQPPVDDDKLNPADNLEEFAEFTGEALAWYRQRIEALDDGNRGIILTMPGAAFGDIALVPAPWMKHPKGIRDIEEWYVSTAVRKDYVLAIFEKQCEIALKNLEKLIPILGDRVQAVFITGTDFGTQRGPFISKQAYRELFKPFHKRVNDLVHAKSSWKTFIHSCGSVFELLPDFIEAGFDILNPVQCSAACMDARTLKKEFGKHLVFWGGGANTQQTLPFGTPDEVYREARERIDIFGEGGGFVFDTVHNIQGPTPAANLLAMFKAIKDSSK
ncbi:MAG: methyltransferase [Verrucomicrobia bacterium]|nr:methyltransferase [Verrucomicrobiota bacterium]